MVDLSGVLPIAVVDVESTRKVETIRDEAGEIRELRPIHGSERAVLKLDLLGIVLHAELTLTDVNRLIARLEVRRDEVGGNVDDLEAAIQLFDRAGGQLIHDRADATVGQWKRDHDRTVQLARQLLGEPSSDD